MSETENKQTHNQSRRNFLKNSGLTVGGLIVGGAIGRIISMKPNSTPTTTQPVETHQMANYNEALQFFTRKEDFEALAAATEVIFPEDKNGLGAIGLGAPYYIDKQLATPWGRNADDYMIRPFKNGQTPLTRGDIMLQGVRKINEVSQKTHNALFNTLSEEEQVAILQEFEGGTVEMAYVSSTSFFALLRQLTLEGCYCDPMYGGNKNMEGWKMKEWPGAQMSHADVADASDFVKKEPKSLSDHM